MAVSNAQTRERMKLKEMFEDAYEKCRTVPMEGVPFTIEDFHTALDKYDFNSEIGTRVFPSLSLSLALFFFFLCVFLVLVFDIFAFWLMGLS